MTMTTSYYGFYYRHGVGAVCGDTGHVLGTLHRFATRADRDAWVAARLTGCRGSAGYRDAVTRAWAIKNGNLSRYATAKYPAVEIERGVVGHRDEGSL